MCNKITIKPFSWKDVKNVNLILYKNEPNKLFSPTVECIYTVYIGKKKIALINFDIVENIGLYINLFEVFDKRKGYGTRIIQELQKTGEFETIDVNPIDKVSYSFWSKLGFSMLTDGKTMRWKK